MTWATDRRPTPAMTAEQYRAALARLGLTHASKRTAQLLGIEVNTSQKYAAGDLDVSAPVARLLRMYERHGLPSG